MAPVWLSLFSIQVLIRVRPAWGWVVIMGTIPFQQRNKHLFIPLDPSRWRSQGYRAIRLHRLWRCGYEQEGHCHGQQWDNWAQWEDS